uniref:Uncharacterized protein n=1 Tax=Physcomitrium patens TaxID=3218 RepID=A0A2K1KD69_PHYPA|nr:hypothetical protein PHYPA_010905 [Physcomitrium patens]
MPEMLASHSAQRFSALLAFQRDVDPAYPTHMGKASNAGMDEFSCPDRRAPGHHRVRHDDSWQQNWSDTLSAFLASSFRPKQKPSPPARPCGVEAMASSSRGTLTRSQGQFSPQRFIQNAVKRALGTTDFATNAKRPRFEDQFHTPVPMVCG